MGIYSIKPAFQRFLTPLKNLFVKYRVSPTAINIGGLLLSILAGWSLYFSFQNNAYVYLLIVPVCAFFRTAFNALDGLVSRELKLASNWGEVLNEFLDRISDAVIFLGITFGKLEFYIIGTITVVIILLNSYLSIVSKAAGGKRQYGGIMGKADRMTYLGIMAVLSFLLNHQSQYWVYFLFFIAIGTLVTMMQRYKQIKKELS